MLNEQVESVMAIAFELARIREEHGAQSGMYLSEVRALRAEVERLAAQAARDDAALYQTIGERDNYHKLADKLADGIATHLGIDIGEHTAGMGSAESNNPWANALEAIQSADPPACPNCRGSGCVQQMTGHLGPDDYEETVGKDWGRPETAAEKWNARALLAEQAQEPKAEDAPSDDELKDLAHSAYEEAMSFGLSVDTFLRYFKGIRNRAAIATERKAP